jgi:hypothetical protein
LSVDNRHRLSATRKTLHAEEACRYDAGMRISLNLHPGSRCAAVTDIGVEAVRPSPGSLVLRYVATGDMAGLRLPTVAEPVSAHGLWRHTCFEAFVRAPAGGAYYEFNLSPSTQWAAYRFDGHRSGMGVAGGIGAPRIEVRSDGTRFELQAALALDRLPDLPVDSAWRLGLSAVIEEADGNVSYWALAHPPGKPDFHHSDCLALELPAA